VNALLAASLSLVSLYSSALAQPDFYSFWPINGQAAGDRLGQSVSAAGDFNGDGIADFMVSAPDEDSTGPNAGAVRVYSMVDGAVLRTFVVAPDERFGWSVSNAGDVNRDGRDDIIVGTPFSDANGTDSGKVWVFSGFDGALLYIRNGNAAFDNFGWSVSAAGDVNNDGFDDFVVGAVTEMFNGFRSGTARVYSGSDGSVLYTFGGAAPSDRFGSSVSGVGDVNGDGFDDVLVGAINDDSNLTDSGLARVFSGADGSVLYSLNGDSTGDQFGAAVSDTGDVNNDGVPDFIVGAPLDDNTGANSGSARVFSGASGAVLHTFNGDAERARLGTSVSGAGDIDGDGFDDLIVGAPTDGAEIAGPGYARVFSGADGSVLATFTGESAQEQFGWSVSGPGDLDGDGLPDLLVGALNNDATGVDAGSARVYLNLGTSESFPCPGDVNGDGQVNFTDLNGVLSNFGVKCSPGSTLALREHLPSFPLNGDSIDDDFGGSVSGAGDVNADGVPDFIVGAIGDDNNGVNTGSARVFSGVDGAILHTFNGDSTLDFFGFSVSGAGDVNADGYDDLIVGAYEDDNAGTNSGSARVFSGADGAVLYTFNGDAAFDRFGSSVSGARDVNNDGFDDIIVGGPGNDNNGPSAGMARVFSGADGSILYTFNGDSAGIQLGQSVSGIGDINGDGFDDVIAGEGSDSGDGTMFSGAQVFSGVDGSILYTFNGDSATDRLGRSVSGAGDVNNDGTPDFIVGDDLNDDNGNNSGRALVFSGLDGSVLYTFYGDSVGARLGNSVSGAGDINGDGFDDLVVGALGVNADRGSLRVFSGADGSVLYSFSGNEPLENVGRTVSGLGDLNGDGFDDFLIGARGNTINGLRYGSARVFLSLALPSASACFGDLNGDNVVNFADLNAVLSNFGNACPD
jgi:hypothetical protein